MTFEKGSNEDQIKLSVMKEDVLICFVHFILLHDDCVVRLSMPHPRNSGLNPAVISISLGIINL